MHQGDIFTYQDSALFSVFVAMIFALEIFKYRPNWQNITFLHNIHWSGPMYLLFCQMIILFYNMEVSISKILIREEVLVLTVWFSENREGL